MFPRGRETSFDTILSFPLSRRMIFIYPGEMLVLYPESVLDLSYVCDPLFVFRENLGKRFTYSTKEFC